MKRFHIHVGVKDLDRSIKFYSTLFRQPPTKHKPDYAKWMLEDPRINFAISTRTGSQGVDHIGMQVDESVELEGLREAMVNAESSTFLDQGETTCCYAKSAKAWVTDPSGVAWEAYQTMEDAETYGNESENLSQKELHDEKECCAPESACC